MDEHGSIGASPAGVSLEARQFDDSVSGTQAQPISVLAGHAALMPVWPANPMTLCRRHITRLYERGLITNLQALAADELFREFMSIGGIPAPAIDRGHGDAISIEWRSGSRVMSIDVVRDGSLEWFFADLATDETHGDVDLNCLPGEFYRLLRRRVYLDDQSASR